ncbi:MAG: hypothetical protein MI892_20055 [Desulfobacterales bacterium]|nr:hypothetical protein [Desulfobacterales bacterium]
MGVYATIISALLGGSIGALCLHIATKRRNRIELTLKIIEQKNEMIEEIEQSFDILKYHLDANGEVFVPQEPNESDALEAKQKFDTVILAGDFLNRVAFLYLVWRVNYKMIKNDETYKIMLNFVYLLSKTKFKIQVYDAKSVQPSDDYIYRDWQNGWSFLSDFLELRGGQLFENKKYIKERLFEILF